MLVIDVMDFEDLVCVLMYNLEGIWGKKIIFVIFCNFNFEIERVCGLVGVWGWGW